MNILIVDDDKLNLQVAQGYIKMHFPDFKTILCQQPGNVIELLSKEQIDIILMDIMMPEISGIQLLSDIRKNNEYKDIQILMLTALGDAESFSESFELGANDFLRKPIDILEFRTRIKSAANARRNILMLHEIYSRMKEQNIEMKNVNAQLLDAQFHLIQSEKLAAIGELAAGVAHEINNPIGYVGSNLETMGEYLKKMHNFIEAVMSDINSVELKDSCKEPEKIKEAFEQYYKKYKIGFITEDLKGIIKDSQEGISKVSEIVRSLRNFARAGNEDEKIICSVGEMIEQVLLIIRNEAKYNADIYVNSDQDYDIFCHRGQISQVLLNILVNAIQAIKSQNRSEKGKITISIHSTKEFICISIEDDGPGIPEENLLKIFNPFFTTKDVGQGTGLGLSISYDIIVKKHNGSIEVQSKTGVGTTFLIKIPKSCEEKGI